MKKLYSLIIVSAFFLQTVNAATINVSIGPSGTFTFSPSTFAAVVGDQIIWTLSSGTHTVNSVAGSIPGGAAAINSGTLSTGGATYSYTITVAGTYAYQCNFHGSLAPPSGMIGGFNATVTAIIEPATNLLTSVYPNPFNDKVTIKYNGIESVEVFNVIGDKVKALDLSASENKTEIDFAGFPAGIYFYRTYKEGTLVETRKIVKAN
jgi:plastocyanin